MSILFINACIRDESRTLVLVRDVLSKMSGDVEELELGAENIKPLDKERLEKRDLLIAEKKYGDESLAYARQFAMADEIVIAAPFWDLSFPAILKIYFENITVAGITFRYGESGPVGLCRAKRLVYVTSSGGPIIDDFGYSYIKALANNFYGISDTVAIRATELDVKQISVERVLFDAQVSEVR